MGKPNTKSTETLPDFQALYDLGPVDKSSVGIPKIAIG